MPPLLSHRAFLRVLFVLLALAFVGLVLLFHRLTDDYAVEEARKQALNALLVHRATHLYVTEIQRPEIYRLKEEGRLYPEYFSPSVMSFTFISRSIKDLLNAEREKYGLEPIYFKLASRNPRNPVNQADALEARLLERMNREGMHQFQDVVQLDGAKWLYLAVPIERSTKGCMKCHGDPRDAPRELVAMYGDQAGFFESPDSIRALISIRVPLQGILAAADRVANTLSLGTFVVLFGLFALVAFFVQRIQRQQRTILEQNAALEQLSITDPLTGILNRLGLGRRLDEQIQLARRFAQPFALLILDLDHFKEINDRYGHQQGDVALQRFAARIRGNLRVTDIFGRWGGEEFLIVAPHLSLDEAEKLAEKLRQAVAETAFEEGLCLTVSIGVTEYRDDERDTSLVERADQALYRAKASGRNRVMSA